MWLVSLADLRLPGPRADSSPVRRHVPLFGANSQTRATRDPGWQLPVASQVAALRSSYQPSSTTRRFLAWRNLTTDRFVAQSDCAQNLINLIGLSWVNLEDFSSRVECSDYFGFVRIIQCCKTQLGFVPILRVLPIFSTFSGLPRRHQCLTGEWTLMAQFANCSRNQAGRSVVIPWTPIWIMRRATAGSLTVQTSSLSPAARICVANS